VRLEIKKMGINGEGIAYYKRRPVFIPNCLIGEVVEAKLFNQGKYYLGELKEIIAKSNERIKPKCKHYKYCGGCSLQHCSYQYQLDQKQELVKEALFKYANLKLEDIKINSNSNRYQYRNSLKLSFTYDKNKKLVNCIYKLNSNKPVIIDNCPIHQDNIERLRKEILNILNRNNAKLYNKSKKEGYRGLYIREIGGQIQVVLITGKQEISKQIINELTELKINSLYQYINTQKDSLHILSGKAILLGGNKEIDFEFNNLNFKLSPNSFFQLNTTQGLNIFKQVRNLIDAKCKLIVDMYCGSGVISFNLRDKADKIIAAEINDSAIKNAKQIAKLNHFDNLYFYCEDAANKLKEINEDIDVLIVNPPRSGLSAEIIKTIKHKHINKIIYISCNPATLAKNLNDLKEYKIKHIELFDIFSQTANIESVVLLGHNNS